MKILVVTNILNYWWKPINAPAWLIMLKKINTLVSGNVDGEKNLHPGGLKFIFNRFSGYIIFSSFVAFAFSCCCCFFCLFVCFLKLKVYILIHIRLHGRVNDKKFSPGWFPDTRLLFWGLNRILLVCQ